MEFNSRRALFLPPEIQTSSTSQCLVGLLKLLLWTSHPLSLYPEPRPNGLTGLLLQLGFRFTQLLLSVIPDELNSAFLTFLTEPCQPACSLSCLGPCPTFQTFASSPHTSLALPGVPSIHAGSQSWLLPQENVFMKSKMLIKLVWGRVQTFLLRASRGFQHAGVTRWPMWPSFLPCHRYCHYVSMPSLHSFRWPMT